LQKEIWVLQCGMSDEYICPPMPTELGTSFLQKGGNGIGPQIRVAPRKLSDPANPVATEVFKPKRGRKTKLAAFGLSPTLIKAGNQSYAACLDAANKYRKMRMKELTQLHGHVSAGVGALLASASLALAASRFLYQAAASECDAATLKQASALADSSRQSELAAYELAAKEGVLKRRGATEAAGQPWLLAANGEEKRKPGRKTNAERQERELDVPAVVQSWEEPEDE
jgi:hypothetical protein